MNRITEKIYISDWVDANSYHFLQGNEIKCVLNVCRQKDNDNIDGVKYIHYPMIDGEGTDITQMEHAVRTLELLLNENDKVLVHCLAGVSRSPMVVALYLAWKTGTSFDDGLKFVAGGRPCVDPNNHFLRLGPKVLQKLRGY